MGTLGFFERTPLFTNVQPELVEHLSALATTHVYARGEPLWRAGDTPRSMVWVRSGLVKVVRPAPHGRTALCGLFGSPSSLGELALVKGVPYPTGSIAATDVVKVLSIPRLEMLDAMRRDAALSLNLFSALEGKLSMLHDKIDVLSAGSVDARLATLLLKLYQQFGDDFDDGKSRIPVPLSRQELADLVSTSFETVIRAVSRLERSGVVTTDAGGFTVHDLGPLRCSAQMPVSTESLA